MDTATVDLVPRSKRLRMNKEQMRDLLEAATDEEFAAYEAALEEPHKPCSRDQWNAVSRWINAVWAERARRDREPGQRKADLVENHLRRLIQAHPVIVSDTGQLTDDLTVTSITQTYRHTLTLTLDDGSEVRIDIQRFDPED